VEPAAFVQHQVGAKQALAEALRNPLALGMRLAGAAPFPEDDARLRPVTAEEIDRLTVEDAQAWIEKLVRESPIEVSIVGDLPRERAVELVARYLGSLPARERASRDSLGALRTVKRAEGPRRVERTIETPTEQAFVFSGFYGPDESDRPAFRAMNLATRMLSMRMFAELREKSQLVYSIGASQRAGGAYPGIGVVAAAAPTEPTKAPALADGIGAIYAAFAESGPTAEELAVAKKQFAVLFREQANDPAYWMSRMNLMVFRGISADDIAEDPAAYEAFTVEQVKGAFARHYSAKNMIVVVVTPKSD
jgi:zinc protease